MTAEIITVNKIEFDTDQFYAEIGKVTNIFRIACGARDTVKVVDAVTVRARRIV